MPVCQQLPAFLNNGTIGAVKCRLYPLEEYFYSCSSNGCVVTGEGALKFGALLALSVAFFILIGFILVKKLKLEEKLQQYRAKQ